MDISRKKLKRITRACNLAGISSTVEGVLAELQGVPAVAPVAVARMVAPWVVVAARAPVVVVRRVPVLEAVAAPVETDMEAPTSRLPYRSN